MKKFLIVETKNNNAVHCICYSLERALHLLEVVKSNCEKGYYVDKSLTTDSFIIKEIIE